MKAFEQQEVKYRENEAISKQYEHDANQLKQQIKELESKLVYANRNDQSKQRDLLDTLVQRVSGFIGPVKDLIKPIEQKYSLAIGMSLNSILNYIVVENM